ncbi:MAG: type II toxin-antitoxin system VapC family toxin [Myxococcales bacterium]
MSFLLDTNVVSELRKPSPNSGVKAWFASVDPEQLFLSVLAVGEIRIGIERLRRRDPERAKTFDAWLETLESDYADRLLPITADIAQEWGRLNVPNPLSVVDGLMAATAKVQGLTLVTRNTQDVARTGIQLLNPFQ